MKIALITTDKFTDSHLLELILAQHGVTEVICGSEVGHAIICSLQLPNIIIKDADGELAQKAYNAINEAETVIVLTNGKGSSKKTRTNLAITDAIRKGKELYVYPYKSSAFDIKKIEQYVKLDFNSNIKRAFNMNGVYLTKSEVEKLIELLQEVIEQK
jgi:hypothetical protein